MPLGRLTRLGRARTRGGAGPAPGDDRRARGDPGRRRQAARRSSRTRCRRSATSSPDPAARRLEFDAGDLDIEDLIDDEERRRHDDGARLHQDRGRRRVPHPGPGRSGRGRAPSCATRTTSRTSSTRPPTRTCCSSRTGARSTGSRRTRSRCGTAPPRARRSSTCCRSSAGRAHPDDHRHPRLRDPPLPVLRHPQRHGEEDPVQRLRLVAAGRPHRHHPARRRRARPGHAHLRRRRHPDGVAEAARRSASPRTTCVRWAAPPPACGA